MKNIYQKLKHWYRGKYISYQSMQEIMDFSRPRYREELKPLPDNFNPPLIVKIINPICRFWLKHWTILLLAIIILLSIVVALFIHFDSKP